MKKLKEKKTINTTKVLDQMIEWSFECGKILNSHLIKSYKRPLKLLDKGKQGLATEADLLSEAYVMKQILKYYPSHQILSEEDFFQKEKKIEATKENEYLWLIDPLDGTNNFYNKVAFFCVSLALYKGKDPLVGVVYNPVSCELFYAVKGKGAFLIRLIGDREIKSRLEVRSRKKKGFEESLLSANLTSKRIEKDFLKTFPQVRAIRRLGSAALELSYVAAGMLDAYWEYNLKPWDLAAAGLICSEAGVNISGIKGEVFNPFCSSVIAADPNLYPGLMNILNK